MSRNTSTQLSVKSRRRFLGRIYCQFIHKQTVRPLVSMHIHVLLSCSHVVLFQDLNFTFVARKKKVVYKKKNTQSVILFINSLPLVLTFQALVPSPSPTLLEPL